MADTNANPANRAAAAGPERILLIRLDRIGDLVLTLPVDQDLSRASGREWKAKWWVPKGLSFIVRAGRPARDAIEIEKEISFARFFALVRELRDEKFTHAIVFHAPWWVGAALRLAGIPVRGGVRSQWHSVLFFNRSVRQKRSRAEYSELEYNFMLVESILRLAPNSLRREPLRLAGYERDERDSFLRSHALAHLGYLVVHPGMGGSALNWPNDDYEKLIRALVRSESVVVTGTAADERYLAPLRENLKDESKVVWLDGKLSGDQLITLLASAKAVVAPSTGVLHLAASTGRPTLGLFSPVRVQSPKRWGPQGTRVGVLVPSVTCPGEMKCLEAACGLYPCMPTIALSQVLQMLAELGSNPK